MSFLRSFKTLGIYLIVVFIVVISFHFILKLYFKHNYSAEKAEKLLSSASSFKYYNDSPCAAAIYGDPVDAGLNYVKVNFHCGGTKFTTNTLDLRGVKELTRKGVIQLLGNINGFRTEASDSGIASLGEMKSGEGTGWRCFTDSQEIKDFSVNLKQQQTINCFYNFEDFQIKQYNENH